MRLVYFFTSITSRVYISNTMARTRGMASQASKAKGAPKETKGKAASQKKDSVKGKKEKVDKATVDKTTKTSKVVSPGESASVEVPINITEKALAELYKFNINDKKESEKPGLFDDDEEDGNDLYLHIQTKKFNASKPEFKPKVIKLEHTLYDIGNHKTCLIVRDDLVTTEAQLEQIEDAKIPSLSQIYTLTQVKKEFKTYEKRRELYASFDMFVVDDALLNTLPTVLGKVFYGYSHNKIPLPIRVTTSSNKKQFSTTTIKNQVEKCLLSTYYLPPVGVNISVKVGTVSENNESTVSNVRKVLTAFEKDKIRSIMLKTKTSPSLPLFYTESLYNENEDVITEKQTSKEDEASDEPDVKLSQFEKGLLELADVDDVNKIIRKKMKSSNKKRHGAPKSKIVKPSRV